MHCNSLFFNYAAYKWAENFIVKKALLMELDGKKLFEDIVNDQNCADVETFFFTDTSNENSHPIMMNRMLYQGKVKIIAYYCTNESYEKMKEELPELCAVLQMNGRITYTHYLALNKAELPTITISA